MAYLTFIFAILLVLLSGLFSGLTLGLLGLDKTEVERKKKLGDKRAKKIYPVRKKGNLLLCTLLLGNVAVNSALAILLGSVTSGLVGGVIATGLIVIFGEILPQATISRYALTIGAKTVWIVKIFMFILFPICYPIAKTLDKLLGEEMPTIWSRHELEEIIKLHEDSPRSTINANEEKIILGALTFSEKTTENIMTPKSVVFALEANTLLDEITLEKIKNSGFTRIPVYKKSLNNIIGILYAKKLIGLKKKCKAKSICKKDSLIITSNTRKLDSLLNQFIHKRVHLAIILNHSKEFVGLVTLEDILEEVLKKEIVDEDDSAIDLQKLAKEKLKNNQ